MASFFKHIVEHRHSLHQKLYQESPTTELDAIYGALELHYIICLVVIYHLVTHTHQLYSARLEQANMKWTPKLQIKMHKNL